MRRSLALICVCWLGIAATGCATHQVCDDQERIRCCLLKLYTDQIMDNLIRAANGLPIVQLDYSDATGSVTVVANASFSGSQQTGQTRAFTLAGLASLTRQITTGFMYGTMASDSNQVTIHASPVLNNNEVYNAYLEFLKKPGSLQSGAEPPPCGTAHLVRRYDNSYYWVPSEFKFDFLRLALVTTVQRGQPLAAPTAFEVSVADAKITDTLKSAGDLSYRLQLQLKKKVPNDDGTLIVGVKGAPRNFDGVQPSGAVPYGGDTDVMNLLYSQTKTGIAPADLIEALKAQPLKIELKHFRPSLPTTDDLLRSVRNELEQIRLDQLRR